MMKVIELVQKLQEVFILGKTVIWKEKFLEFYWLSSGLKS